MTTRWLIFTTAHHPLNHHTLTLLVYLVSARRFSHLSPRTTLAGHGTTNNLAAVGDFTLSPGVLVSPYSPNLPLTPFGGQIDGFSDPSFDTTSLEVTSNLSSSPSRVGSSSYAAGVSDFSWQEATVGPLTNDPTPSDCKFLQRIKHAMWLKPDDQVLFDQSNLSTTNADDFMQFLRNLNDSQPISGASSDLIPSLINAVDDIQDVYQRR